MKALFLFATLFGVYEWPAESVYNWPAESVYAWPDEPKPAAKPRKRPFLYYFTSPGCSGCVDSSRHLHDRQFVPASWSKDIKEVNARERPDLVEWFEVETFPSFVVVDEVRMKQLARVEPGDTFDARAFVLLGLTAYNCHMNNSAEFSVAPPQKLIKTNRYPIRSNSTWWTGCDNWQHMQSGQHASLKLSSDYLRALSWEELQSLHSDAHDNALKFQFLVTR